VSEIRRTAVPGVKLHVHAGKIGRIDVVADPARLGQLALAVPTTEALGVR
jgi:hypothetical protein